MTGKDRKHKQMNTVIIIGKECLNPQGIGNQIYMSDKIVINTQINKTKHDFIDWLTLTCTIFFS